MLFSISWPQYFAWLQRQIAFGPTSGTAAPSTVASTRRLRYRTYPFYDAAYLNNFIAVARDRPVQILAKSALELYVRPTLLWIDIGFCGVLRGVRRAVLAWLKGRVAELWGRSIACSNFSWR
jgi:hypothetical protein